MELPKQLTVNGRILNAIHHDSGTLAIVIFCHGYRSSSIGPSRTFVRAARMLGERHVSSLRFDQYGSGDSDGDFFNSRFSHWVQDVVSMATDYQAKGYKVFLFGQSMGASTVIVAASQLQNLGGIVAWVPDASVDEPVTPAEGYFEEGGQRVNPQFWMEAHTSNIPSALSNVTCPALIFQAERDEYVDEDNHDAIRSHALQMHEVRMLNGHSHSSWSYDQATAIIQSSVDFICNQLT